MGEMKESRDFLEIQHHFQGPLELCISLVGTREQQRLKVPFSLACLILASSWVSGDKSSLAEKAVRDLTSPGL